MSEKTRGRKPIQFEWPAGEFTVKEVQSSIPVKMTTVAIQRRVNKAVETDELTLLPTKRSSGGCPSRLYKKADKKIEAVTA